MRTKRALLNMLSSVLLQIVTIVSSFILPRLLLRAFGSEVNGAVASITQFLGYISLIEAGVGGVTRAALYSPLAHNDTIKVSGIMNATQSFFKKIAYIFIGYTVVLALTFKYISHTELSWLFTSSLVVILSISVFAEYYFGISFVILFQADQRSYIVTSLQIVVLILNTFLSVLLLNLGFGIHVIKLIGAGIFLIRPTLLSIYARKQYNLQRSAPQDNEAIKQRWNGFGHHIGYCIHNYTDTVVVTIVLGLKWASVYAIYHLILNGLGRLVLALTGSSAAAFGNMIAKNEQEVLKKRFNMTETLSSVVIVCFFTSAGLLLFDFVRLYTAGVKDIEYVNIYVGVFFLISEALHCVKQNYHNLVLAAGHYKETQKGAFVEAGLNLGLSLLLAPVAGLPGILSATILATSFRIVDYAFHLKNNILNRRISTMIIRHSVNVLNVLLVLLVFKLIPNIMPTNYWEWTVKALKVGMLSLGITLSVNVVFYKENIMDFLRLMRGILPSK